MWLRLPTTLTVVVTSRRPLVARRCLSLSLRMIFDCCCSRCLCCLRRLTFLRGLHSPLAGFAGHRRSRRVATRTGLNLNPLTGKKSKEPRLNEPRSSLSLTAPETHLAYVAVVVFSTFSSLLAFWSAMKAALQASWLAAAALVWLTPTRATIFPLTSISIPLPGTTSTTTTSTTTKPTTTTWGSLLEGCWWRLAWFLASKLEKSSKTFRK